MDMHTITSGVVGLAALGVGFWALGKFGPDLVVGKLHAGLEALKASAWVRNPARPQRARWLLATLQLLEEEIPEPGQGQEVYDALAAATVAHVPFGSKEQWAKVYRQFGDAVDTELDADVKALAGPQTP